jgi:hypothetical protein
MMRALRPAGVALLAALLFPPAARALDPAAPPANTVTWADLFRSSAVTVYLENDKFFAGTDRHYTNGFKLSFLGDTTLNQSPAFVHAVAKYIPTLPQQRAEQEDYKVGLAIGQNIYTPTDTETAAPLLNDRPYAAWLYGALIFQAKDPDENLLRVVELQFGMVGPAALGEQIQNGWHSIIQVKHAQGWSNQLHNEPGVVLSWERRYRVKRVPLDDGDLAAELVARGGISLGNVDTHAGTGLMLRLGWRLPFDFGPDLIRAAGVDAAPAGRSSFYFFGGAEGRAVGRNIFLDGNTWQDSQSVDKRPIVGDLNAGLVVRCPCRLGGLKGLQFVYSENYRTKEFYGQLQRDVFGSISISTLF